MIGKRKWPWWRRGARSGLVGGGEPAGPEGALVEEVTAFLSGTYPAWLYRHGRAIEPWAWLNPVAHTAPGEVTATNPAGGARPAASDDVAWAAVARRLAAELADRGDLAVRQRECLVSLELRLAAGAVRVRTPDELLAVARAALETVRG